MCLTPLFTTGAKSFDFRSNDYNVLYNVQETAKLSQYLTLQFTGLKRFEKHEDNSDVSLYILNMILQSQFVDILNKERILDFLKNCYLILIS